MTQQEANKLINKYVKLREKLKKSEKFRNEFAKHERLCIEKFKYIVLMRTAKYKQFANYDDLNQEGLEALLKALNSYKPEKKGNCFWWIHKYVDTRVARHASLHTAVRYPIKYAKENPPHKESALPVIIDEENRPDRVYENQELLNEVESHLYKLNAAQKKVAQMVFGFNGERPQSVNKICKRLSMSRPTCVKILDQVLTILRQSVRL